MQKISKILSVLIITTPLNVFSATPTDGLEFSISGVIEVEYGVENLAIGGGSDSLTLSTAEINIARPLNEKFDAYIILLYEQDENNNNIIVDEAVLNGKTVDGKYAFAVGRLYVPFGAYETAAISDPTGSDIGETNDEAIVLRANFLNDFSAAIWLADNTNAANNSGVSLGFEAQKFAFGIDWMNKIAAVNNAAGLAIHTQYNWDNFAFIAERVIENFGVNKAQSTQIEVDYTTQNWVFAIAHNNIDNFGDYDSNIILAGEYTLAKGLGLAAEYKTQNKTDNTGNDKVSNLRLAYEF